MFIGGLSYARALIVLNVSDMRRTSLARLLLASVARLDVPLDERIAELERPQARSHRMHRLRLSAGSLRQAFGEVPAMAAQLLESLRSIRQRCCAVRDPDLPTACLRKREPLQALAFPVMMSLWDRRG